jgi:hypothetical protein
MPAVMCGAAQGEHIARAESRSNDQDLAGAQTPRGLPCASVGSGSPQVGAKWPLIETPGRRWPERVTASGCEARGRRRGEIPAKAVAGRP